MEEQEQKEASRESDSITPRHGGYSESLLPEWLPMPKPTELTVLPRVKTNDTAAVPRHANNAVPRAAVSASTYANIDTHERGPHIVRRRLVKAKP